MPRTIGNLSDKRVPFLYKLIPFLVIPFYFTPVGRLFNAYAVWGLADDFTIILLSAALFTWLSDNYLRKKYPDGNKGESVKTTIEGEFTVVSEETRPR
ncbi:hypothetical protein OZ401_002819 [Candidatus Chlorohelix allophototropha]|uniref:DUF1232 domain-containing protein n=1 Tax=Candidatus Chlorohelix allophototropha TaxID=3003348 RepID=A0ABY9B7W6_9CHLR|nr:hypothetical protein OZ401_002819 [Chloroflexota bacterium L227-S17]